MTKKIIEYATRKISFCVNEEIVWTQQDEQLLKAYLQLHDREEQLKKQGEALLKNFSIVNKQTEKARKMLATLKNHITDLSKLADSFNIADPLKKVKEEKISKEAGNVYTEISKYQQVIEELDKLVNEHSGTNGKFIDEVESMDLWEAYSEVKHVHYNNYADNAIDIMSFDNEDEMFRGYISIRRDANHGFIDYSNEAINNYNILIHETNLQYGIWEEFVKRLNLIRAIAGNTTTELFASAN